MQIPPKLARFLTAPERMLERVIKSMRGVSNLEMLQHLWTVISVLIQLIGFGLMGYIAYAIITTTGLNTYMSVGWRNLVIADFAIITWMYIMFYTNWYSLWFVENNPGRATLGRSKWSKGKKDSNGNYPGVYVFRAGWQGIPIWVTKLEDFGLDLTTIVEIDTKKDGDPLKIIYGGSDKQLKATLNYRAELSLWDMPEGLIRFALTNEQAAIDAYRSETKQRIEVWCRGKSEDELFLNLDNEESALRKFMENIYGSDKVTSAYEKERGLEIKKITLTDLVQDKATAELKIAEKRFEKVANGTEKLIKALGKAGEIVDGSVVLMVAKQLLDEESGTNIVIAGNTAGLHGIVESAMKKKNK